MTFTDFEILGLEINFYIATWFRCAAKTQARIVLKLLKAKTKNTKKDTQKLNIFKKHSVKKVKSQKVNHRIVCMSTSSNNVHQRRWYSRSIETVKYEIERELNKRENRKNKNENRNKKQLQLVLVTSTDLS